VECVAFVPWVEDEKPVLLKILGGRRRILTVQSQTIAAVRPRVCQFRSAPSPPQEKDSLWPPDYTRERISQISCVRSLRAMGGVTPAKSEVASGNR
jgi:hypothetical protein